ncbi:MAG: aminotransferase class I/II-fold pyridoxal phosphate-dependent enzyme, partial [Pseudomonadota bacterium]|nr:aminotransferase class I/II-fold pyridoxal phosphate-dependent enzyme [Pseudomonadota bacterium]
AYAERYGAGAGASRLITGNGPAYAGIEAKLAKGKGTEAALVLSSGYQANLTVLAALADEAVIGRPVTILADRLCHNSLLQGARLSGASVSRFRHNDYDHLEQLLRRASARGAQSLIVSESVFSMDGDCADLGALAALARHFDAMLYIDEAHATGLFGPGGFGLAAGHRGSIDVIMGTFGKALGGFGAYIACGEILRDYLVQRCGGLIYSTALPPSVLGAMDAALELLPFMDQERAYVLEQAGRVRAGLQAQGWDCGTSTTQIIPIILGGSDSAMSLADELQRHDILAAAIRPPTVPPGTSRLRLSISAAHKLEDLDHLLAVMGKLFMGFSAPSCRAIAS